MEDRMVQARNYILGMFDSRQLDSGVKLPGARELALETGISLLTIQNAIDTLVNEGILETIPRRGTFVQLQWKERLVQRSLYTFLSSAGCMKELQAIVKTEMPELWVSQRPNRGIFEIQPTHYVQSHRDDYMDLSGLFDRCFPDRSDFFMEPFDSFRSGSRLYGVPIIFSPRVMFFNPKLFDRAGCPRPSAHWTWDEFIAAIRKLKRILPPENIFNWYLHPFVWLTTVLAAGGQLLDPAHPEDMVRIDSAETRRGLALFRRLRYEMWGNELHIPTDFDTDFLTGKAAMTIGPREFRNNIVEAGFDDWDVVSLPRIPGGKEHNLQATDLFCVRKECVDMTLAARLLGLLLSESMQNMLADRKYGLPIRRSAFGRTIDYGDPRDVVFLNEIPNLYASYHLDSEELYNLVWQGIANLLAGDEDIDRGATEIADMVRTYLKIKNASRHIA